MNVRRKKDAYFESIAGMPYPLMVYIKRRVKFSEADVMGIVWRGDIAASGYTVQMFIDEVSGDVLIASPEILGKCRRRWKAGEFA